MFAIEIRLGTTWTRITSDYYHSRGDAEWALGQWKAANQCRGDTCFRVVAVT